MKPSQEKLVILVAAMSQLSMQFVANMATILIPEISMELNISTELQLWINLIYLCSLVAISIPLGKIISQKGVKKSVMISYGMSIVSLLLCGFSVNFEMVLLGRFIQGLCCAVLGMSIYIMLVEELDEEALGGDWDLLAPVDIWTHPCTFNNRIHNLCLRVEKGIHTSCFAVSHTADTPLQHKDRMGP